MSKHDTVKTITEQNILQNKFEHFHVTKTSGSQAKKKKKNLTINKTCVCDPHSLNIFNLDHEGEEKKKESKRERESW